MNNFFSMETKDQGKIYKIYWGLFDYGDKKHWTGAIGFYIAYLTSIGIGLNIAGLFLKKILRITTYNTYEHRKIILGLASFCIAYLTYDVMRKRKLPVNLFNSGLLIFSGISTFFLGTLVGMIVPTYLTTRESN